MVILGLRSSPHRTKPNTVKRASRKYREDLLRYRGAGRRIALKPRNEPGQIYESPCHAKAVAHVRGTSKPRANGGVLGCQGLKRLLSLFETARLRWQ